MIATDIVVQTIALGLVLMVVGVQADGFVVIPNHPNCPAPEGPVPVYFVHPTNCSKFYECHRKDAYEFECPAGLHFNTRLKVCDHPMVAQCESQGPATTETPPQMTSTAITTGPTQRPTSTQITPEWTTIDTPMTPSDTPMTTTSTSAPQPTTTTPLPTPTYSLPTTYSTTTHTPETTVFPTNTNPYPTTTQVPVNPPTDPHCPPAGASLPNYWSHPSDCTKYLACWEGCIQQFKCPDGRYWNDGLKACDQNSWQCTCPVIPPAPNAFSPT
uniref:Chitin-binding type-2 domain-containing protein n=1 Tax=Anopheles atroparvus TaxID=41427 RepID=A0A182IWW4_ANOAO